MTNNYNPKNLPATVGDEFRGIRLKNQSPISLDNLVNDFNLSIPERRELGELIRGYNANLKSIRNILNEGASISDVATLYRLREEHPTYNDEIISLKNTYDFWKKLYGNAPVDEEELGLILEKVSEISSHKYLRYGLEEFAEAQNQLLNKGLNPDLDHILESMKNYGSQFLGGNCEDDDLVNSNDPFLSY